jgi:hypothetical protein
VGRSRAYQQWRSRLWVLPRPVWNVCSLASTTSHGKIPSPQTRLVDIRRSDLTQNQRPSKLLIALVILQFLAVLFTLSALIFVFIVTSQTKGQSIRIPIAANAQGQNYPEYKWTPETWFKAVLDLPLADKHMRDEIDSKITNMVTWRWMLVPILAADVIAFGVTTLAWLRQRKGMTARPDSANTVEK